MQGSVSITSDWQGSVWPGERLLCATPRQRPVVLGSAPSFPVPAASFLLRAGLGSWREEVAMHWLRTCPDEVSVPSMEKPAPA